MSEPVLIWINPVTEDAEDSSTAESKLTQRGASDPALVVTDLSATRGDGIFETLGVINGNIQAMGPHLARLQRSANMLDLPALDLAAVEAAIKKCVELHEDVAELHVKVVVTRGVEGTGVPSAWAYAFEADPLLPTKRQGIKVVRLDRGYRSDVAETSPWLLQGAKTLSYAVNMAALREAARRGADEVIFLSTDGYVLEGPRSTVVAKFGNTLVTPTTEHGILPGTTQGDLFEIAEELGYETQQRPMLNSEFETADAMWFVSSGQILSPIVELDGQPVPQAPEVGAILLEKLMNRSR